MMVWIQERWAPPLLNCVGQAADTRATYFGRLCIIGRSILQIICAPFKMECTIAHFQELMNPFLKPIFSIYFILANYSPTFRKMFPEYVEKYNQLQAAEQLVLEQAMPRKEDTTDAVATPRNAMNQEANGRKENTNDARNRRRPKKFPIWLLLLLVWVFGFLMALPLLQS